MSDDPSPSTAFTAALGAELIVVLAIFIIAVVLVKSDAIGTWILDFIQ